ncbi:MAG TPA: ribosome-associated translation inhibitor RaiA [Anaerolineales bacterium]|jgi:putative sigma-54 modulation protein|nr:ribosome-associated translation inhibitor RaiA [Anaerolineales bacterium]
MSIDVDIRSNGFQLNDRVFDYVNKRAGKLDRYINDLEEVRVELTYAKSAKMTTDRWVAQITLLGKKIMLRAEERADDIYPAFDMAMDKIQRRIERFKGKRHRGRGDGVSVGQAAMELTEADLAAELAEEEEPVIARRKKFILYPMDEYEAVEQSKLLGHEDFFIFFNMETNSVNVLYTRRDGTYGLIDTEMA